MSSFEGINSYYRDRLAAERVAYAEAELQAQLEGTSGDVIWRRWRDQAEAEHKQARGLSPHAGLSFGDQQDAHARLPAIAERARQQRERAALSPRAQAWQRAADFQQAYYVEHGTWPSLDIQRAAGIEP